MPAKIYPNPWIVDGPMSQIKPVMGGLMVSDLSKGCDLGMGQ